MTPKIDVKFHIEDPQILGTNIQDLPIPVAARSNASVYGRSHKWDRGFESRRGMDVFLL